MVKSLCCNKFDAQLREGFNSLSALDAQVLLTDDRGANSGKEEEITSIPFDSIPSPFARLEMVKQAFEYVNRKFGKLKETDIEGRKKVLNGKSYYHKIISECLDTGMLFCYGEAVFGEKCSIENVGNFDKNGVLGKSLDLFWEKFKDFSTLWVAKWNGVVVGGTSPVSLFVPTSDVKTYLIGNAKRYSEYQGCKDEQIVTKFFPAINSYTLYAGESKSLIERPIDFITYIYKNSLTFVNHMPDFYQYVKNSISVFDLDKQAQITDPASSLRNDSPIVIFEKDNLRLNRTNVVSNGFFEDYIVESLWPVEETKFFCLKLGNRYFFPPVKNSYFEAGNTVDDLKKNLKIFDSKSVAKGVSLAPGDDSVVVQLTIDGSTSLEKIYSKRNEPTAKIGAIYKNDREFCLTFLPFLKPEENIEGRVWVSTDTETVEEIEQYDIKFFNGDQEVAIAQENLSKVTDRINVARTILNNVMYKIASPYDHIGISLPDNKSLLIIPDPEVFDPKKKNGGEYSFSVDIGTTNTHIAYLKSGAVKPEAFNIFDGDFCVNLFKGEDFETESLIGKLIDFQTVPNQNNAKKMGFPLKTVLWKDRNELNSQLHCWSHAGWNFVWGLPGSIVEDDNGNVFGKRPEVDFKWSKGKKESMRIAIEEICYLIAAFLNKNGGKLQKLTATYPVSMFGASRLNQCWSETSREILGNFCSRDYSFEWVTESQAPLLFYQNKNTTYKMDKLFVTIDIGGGSTDISISDKKNKVYIASSFQFAGNVIFGDSMTKDGNDNLFTKQVVELAKNSFLDEKEANRLSEDIALKVQQKIQYLEWLINKESSSSDINSYLFSDNTLKYSSKLVDNEYFELILYYFYAAIIYHICQILKKYFSGVLPHSIIFSGNGSKILSNLEHNTFTDFTDAFFKKCLGLEGDTNKVKNIVFSESPKTLTALGGLYADANIEKYENKVVYPDCDAEEEKTADELKSDKECGQCLDQVADFNKLFKELSKQKLGSLFQNPKQLFKVFESRLDEVDQQSLEDYYNQGFVDGYEDTDILKETPFFFPIKFVINDIMISKFDDWEKYFEQ